MHVIDRQSRSAAGNIDLFGFVHSSLKSSATAGGGIFTLRPPCLRRKFSDRRLASPVKPSLSVVHRENRRDSLRRARGIQLSTFGSINRKSMLCLPSTTRGPGTAFQRSSRGQHHLHAPPGPGSIQHASRANVKMEGSRRSPQSNSRDDPEHSHLPTLSNLVKARQPDEAAGIRMLCGR